MVHCESFGLFIDWISNSSINRQFKMSSNGLFNGSSKLIRYDDK